MLVVRCFPQQTLAWTRSRPTVCRREQSTLRRAVRPLGRPTAPLLASASPDRSGAVELTISGTAPPPACHVSRARW
jgi:hypothetical protein